MGVKYSELSPSNRTQACVLLPHCWKPVDGLVQQTCSRCAADVQQMGPRAWLRRILPLWFLADLIEGRYRKEITFICDIWVFFSYV